MSKERLQRFLGGTLHREMNVGAFDAEKRTVEVAFSSCEPVERWGAEEVLSHDKGAVDLSRLNNGAPVLFNHDPDQQLGVVESATIDSKDEMGRAVVRFGNSPLANEKFQDVKDGILKKVSVGYRIKAVKLTEESDDGPDTYTVTSWQPHEISFVTIPADDSVGVGRTLPDVSGGKPHTKQPQKSNIMNRDQIIALLTKRGVKFATDASDETLANLVIQSEPATVDVVSERRNAANDEQARTRTILELGERYKMPEIANKSVKEGKSFDETRGLMLEEMEKRSKNLVEASSPIGLNDKEVKRFSVVNLIRALSDPTDSKAREDAAFEMEACRAAADKIKHRQVKGVMIPSDILRDGSFAQRSEGNTIVSGITGTGYTGTAGNTIQTSILAQSFIDILRNKTVALKLAGSLTGLVGNVDLPKQLNHASGYWISEDGSATKQGADFGVVLLQPHTAANLGEITRRMLMQSSLGIESIVRNDLVAGIALAIDKAVFYGTGASGQPTGLASTSGINAVNFATSGAPTFGELVDMETLISQANADVDGMRYVINPTTRGYAKKTHRLVGATDSQTIWEPGNSINGYGVEVTNQVNSGDVFFGNFSDLVIGMWGGLEVLVDPYTNSATGRIRIVAMQDVDVAVRRALSFTYGTYFAGAAGETLSSGAGA